MSAKLTVSLRAKQFSINGSGLAVLGPSEFEIEAGEFVSLLGPSGCGKTTLLRLLLGLDRDFHGDLQLAGKRIEGPGLDRGAVFQEPRLLPWMTVYDNIRFAIKSHGDSAGRHDRVSRLIDTVGLRGFESAWPAQLSGGMAQRAALARALVNVPQLLLLDEPLGALDGITRMQMQSEILAVLARERTTTLLVTHDMDEAVFMSDRVLIMTPRPGRVLAELRIPLPRGRNRQDTEFIRLRSELMRRFYELIA